MSADIKHAVHLLYEDDFTCVLCKNDIVLTDTARGILPLIRWYESGRDFSGFSAADRVVGKGAAFLYALMKVKCVHAGVLSEGALSVLETHGIKWSGDIRVPAILNRDETGLCPMEQTVANVSGAQEALKRLKCKLKTMGLYS